MGRRRRTLLGSSRGKAKAAPATEPTEAEGDDAPADAEAVDARPEEAEERAAQPDAEAVAEPEPVAEPEAGAEPPMAAQSTDAVGADDPTVDEVTEPSYRETGAMGEDSTDDGWGSSVWNDESGSAPGAEPPAEESLAGGDAPPIEYSASTPDLPQAQEQTYPSPTGAPPTDEGTTTREAAGYTAPTPPQDAPIAQGLYGDYGEFDGGPPPTEEVPSSVMEDVGTSYNAPMNVPEPPPIPGILDRFTPPPVDRTSGAGGGYSQPKPPSGGGPSGVPDYLAGMDDGSSTEDDALPEPPGRRKKKVAPVTTSRDDDDVGPGPPMGLILSVLGVGGGAVIGVVWFALVGMGGGGGTTGSDDGGSPLEVRQDMNQEPGLIGVEPEQPKPEPEPEPEPEPDTPDPEPDTPDPQPAAPTPRPQPTEPRPQPRPSPSAPKPTASVGTLKVDANRRVIIRVNGQPKGFTPQRIELPPGTYEVSAAMPGQADTEKKKTVTISAPGTTVGVDFAF